MKEKKPNPYRIDNPTDDEVRKLSDMVAALNAQEQENAGADEWTADQLGFLDTMREQDARATDWAKAALADVPASDPNRRKAEAALAILSSHAYRRRDAIDSRLTFTLRDASHLLQVSERTMRRYIKSGKLRAVKIGREYRITLEDYDAFTAANANR